MTVEEAAQLPLALDKAPMLRARLAKIQNEERRRESLAAYKLLSALCRQSTCLFRGLLPEPLSALDFLESGKPVLIGAEMPFISLSHGGGYVAAAISEREVGIDLEPLDTEHPKDIDAFACRYLPRRIQEKLKALQETEKKRLFLSLYTEREAIVKAENKTLAPVLQAEESELSSYDFTREAFKNGDREYLLTVAELQI